MLDEYKEDFGSGIDDLQFDTPEDTYGYQQEPATEQSHIPPVPSPHVQGPVKRPSQPLPHQVQQEKYIPQQEYQPVPALSRSYAVPLQQQVDPVLYDRVAPPAADVPGIGDILKSREPKLGCLRVLVLSLVSLVVIGVTFWGSFLLGQKIFTPPVKENFLKRTAEQVPDFLNPATRKPVSLPLPSNPVTTSEPEKIFVRSTGLKPHRPAVTAGTYQPARTAQVNKTIYRVIAGSFTSKQNAQLAMQQLKEDGFDAFIAAKGTSYQVQIGAFSSKITAQRLLERALSFGYEAFLAN